MRLAFWQRKTPKGPTASSPWDRWLTWSRWGALALAAILLVATVVPLMSDFSAPNEGGDISITTEFYTAFERGGGFISWDYSVAASQVLRARMDTDNSSTISDGEMFVYGSTLDDALTQGVLVLRNFEIAGVRIDSQRGVVGEPVNSPARAHVRFTFSGQWAQRDSDIILGGDSLARLGFAGNLTPGMTIRERTVIIEGGLASFSGISGNTHVMRVPAGVMVVATGSWTETGESLPRIHFALFSPLDNSLVLLLPLGIALFIGVGGARRERDATGQPRVQRFHAALSAGFLLLIAAYFAAAPGLIVWVAGVGFGAASLMMAYRVYPADKRPEDWRPPQPVAEEDEDAEEAPSRDWAPVVDEKSDGPAMVDPIAAAEEGRTPLGPEPTPVKETPSHDRAPRIFVSSQPKPEASVAPAPVDAAPAAPAAPPPTKIRCPGCKMMFEATGPRPLHVVCPHCGRRGVLR